MSLLTPTLTVTLTLTFGTQDAYFQNTGLPFNIVTPPSTTFDYASIEGQKALAKLDKGVQANAHPDPDPDPNANPNANPNTNLYPNPQVLTHLDASGRSAVGDMLRRVARHPSGASAALGTTGSSEDNHAEELGLGYGTRDTVLVILQDLAATELEESFDSVDVVVKKRDVARVRID